MEIYCKNKNVTKQDNIIDFVVEYYKENQPETYYKDTDELQCPAGKRRSIDDLISLLKTYFQEVNEEKLLKNIIKIKEKYDKYINGNLAMAIFECPDINKVVLSNQSHPDHIKDSIINYDFPYTDETYRINKIIQKYNEK